MLLNYDIFYSIMLWFLGFEVYMYNFFIVICLGNMVVFGVSKFEDINFF